MNKILIVDDDETIPMLYADELIEEGYDVFTMGDCTRVIVSIQEKRPDLKGIMSKNPITVPPDYTIEETAEVLVKNKISSIPVVDNQEKLVGIITQSDLFRVLISLTGERKKGIQFAFQVEDRLGSTKELTDIIRNYNCRLASILNSYQNAPEGYRNIYIKAYQIDREKISELKNELRGKATMLYFVDQR